MLPIHEPWTAEAEYIEILQQQVADDIGVMLGECPAGNRSRGLLAYLKAAERSLEGARLFAEGKDLSLDAALGAQDHLADKALDKSPASEDAAGLLNEVFSSVGETDIEEDSAERHKLTVEEHRLCRAVVDLVVLQYPEAPRGLVHVKSTGVCTGDGRRCFKVVLRDKAGVVVDSSWWTLPGMDAAKVAEAVAQMIRAELDPSVPWPKVEERNPIDFNQANAEAAESRSILDRARAASDDHLRLLYDEHPATDIPPIPWPEDKAWKDGKAGVRICGELWFESHMDECRTWSAVLTRKAFVCDDPSIVEGVGKAQIHALFLARVIGAHTEQLAKDAVVEAARVAGWLSR